MSKTALRSACSWLENAVKQEDIICLLTKWKKEASGSVLAPVLHSARLNKLPDSKALSFGGRVTTLEGRISFQNHFTKLKNVKESYGVIQGN